MARIPLRYRLPNPPASFVGREREVSWLAEAVRRAPVTVVVGPGGLGKSALVLYAAHKRFKKKLPKTLFVSLGPMLSPDEIGQEILRALAEAEQLPSIDWASLQGDPDAVIESLLDLAENGSWWVVLDDLHHGDPVETRRLLLQLSKYARQSKWIATSRMDPRLDDAVQVLTLGAMERADLLGLAQSWAQHLSDDVLTRALHVSGGSPWLLQQCLATGRSEPAVTRDSLLAELPADGRDFLEALSVVAVPLPMDVVATFVRVPDEAQLASLERRGLVEASPAGVRLHDVVRSVLRAPGADGLASVWSERVAHAFAGQQDPNVLLESVRLFLEAGHFTEVARLLELHGDAFVGAGYAPRLWRLLEPMSDERLSRWRLRCAAELGNPTALQKVREPEAPDAADRIAWGYTLYMQGQLAEASELGAELYGELRSGDDAELELSAGLLVARCLALRGERGRAIRHLQGLPQRTPDMVALRDVEIASCLAGTAQGPDALRFADTLRAGLGELSSQVREEVAFGIANIYRLQGRLQEASDLLRAVQATPRGGAPSLFLARRALWLKADIDVTRGAFVEAANELQQLEPFVRSASLLRPQIVATRAALALARGDVHTLDAQLAETAREAASFGARPEQMRIQALRVELATLEGRVVDEDPPSVVSKPAELLRLRLAEQRVRRGDDLAVAELSVVASAGDPELCPLARAALSRMAALSGDLEGALQQASTAVREAATSGHAVREAEAREALCEILLLADKPTELRAAAEELRALAARLVSARFDRSAQWWEQTSQDRPRWGTIEQLAMDERMSPVAGRRAQLLLGGEPPHDLLDRAIVERLRSSDAWSPPEVLGALPLDGGWSAGWGLDGERRVAWLPDGSAVDFTRRALHWRLLETLADAGGQATKERLVVDVWEEPEYHPLKHDARLQVAVRKLRELLEDDPGKPERIVTTEDGYALTGPLRRVR